MDLVGKVVVQEFIIGVDTAVLEIDILDNIKLVLESMIRNKYVLMLLHCNYYYEMIDWHLLLYFVEYHFAYLTDKQFILDNHFWVLNYQHFSQLFSNC